MKQILILIAGCTPLAVLTALSYVELASVGDAIAVHEAVDDSQASSNVGAEALKRVEEDMPAVRELAKTNLLAPKPIPELEKLPEGSSLRTVRDDWDRWVTARTMVREVLGADWPLGSPGINRLKSVCEATRALKEKYEAAEVRDGRQLTELLSDRAGQMKRTITRLELEQTAEKHKARADLAFQTQQYAQAVPLYDEALRQYRRWLDDYAAELDASAIESSLQEMRQRAAQAHLRDKAQRLDAGLKKAASQEQCRQLLQDFLAVEFRGDLLAPQDAQRLERYKGELDEFTAKMKVANEVSKMLQWTDTEKERVRHELLPLEAKMGTAAGQTEIAGLCEKTAAIRCRTLAARLGKAVKIRNKHDLPVVQDTLRPVVRSWLAELIPPKQAIEPEGIQEARMKRGKILRGFFKRKELGGVLYGYQCYPTAKERDNPTAGTGTYPKKDFLTPPGESLPVQCVDRYNRSRERLLGRPALEETWAEFADLCEELDRKLDEYRVKLEPSDGAVPRSDQGLSFRPERQFVRRLMDSADWDQLEELLRP